MRIEKPKPVQARRFGKGLYVAWNCENLPREYFVAFAFSEFYLRNFTAPKGPYE